MNTSCTLDDKRKLLQDQIQALAGKQPQVASHRFVLALVLAGVVLFGGLAAAFYASAAQREGVAARHAAQTSQPLFNTYVEGSGQVQVNNLHK